MTIDNAEPVFPHELRNAWPALAKDQRVESFRLVSQATADDFFFHWVAKAKAS